MSDKVNATIFKYVWGGLPGIACMIENVYVDEEGGQNAFDILPHDSYVQIFQYFNPNCVHVESINVLFKTKVNEYDTLSKIYEHNIEELLKLTKERYPEEFI